MHDAFVNTCEFRRDFLPYRDSLHGVVYDRGDRAVHRVSVEVGVLAGLQEYRRRGRRTAVLRDALQRSVDDELRGSQVERVAGVPSRHPADPGLQADETFRRTPGPDADVRRQPRRTGAVPRRSVRLPARLLQRHLLRRARPTEHADSQHPRRVLVGDHHHDDGRVRRQGARRLLG